MCGIISMMDEMIDLSKAFKALGEPTRLKIVGFVQGCCKPTLLTESGGVLAASGPTAGEVCCSITGVDTINSTVSHHLHQLEEAGLITLQRQGKTMVCTPNPAAFAALVSFLQPFTNGGQENGCC